MVHQNSQVLVMFEAQKGSYALLSFVGCNEQTNEN